MRFGWLCLTWLGIAQGCGRLGFDARDDGDVVVAKPDGRPSSGTDADVTTDAPIGFGSYQVTDATAPYLAPVGAQLVPGFVNGADDESYQLSLPFAFRFYGVVYNTVWVSVNGFVAFNGPVSATDSLQNDCPVDATPPDGIIAVFWDDLFATSTTAPLGTITSLANGTAPDRLFTIEWYNLNAFYQQGSGGRGQSLRLTHKLVLHEAGTFELHYGPRTTTTVDEDCGLDRPRGCSATVGAEASGGASATMIQCGTAAGPMPGYVPIDEGRLITFAPI